MCFHYFVLISPWKWAGHSFEQTWIPFYQGCFVLSLIEIGTVVLKIFKFRYFVIISHLNNHPIRHSTKFGWNWHSGSGEDFLILLIYFRFFVIISPWKRAEPFISTNLNSLLPRMLCAKFGGWNWNSVSEEDF